MSNKKFRYAFMHKTRTKWFGPYDSVYEARCAFQDCYGYWPGACVDTEEWETSSNGS